MQRLSESYSTLSNAFGQTLTDNKNLKRKLDDKTIQLEDKLLKVKLGYLEDLLKYKNKFRLDITDEDVVKKIKALIDNEQELLDAGLITEEERLAEADIKTMYGKADDAEASLAKTIASLSEEIQKRKHARTQEQSDSTPSLTAG